MKILRINSFFARVGRWQVQHRILLLAVVAVFTVIGLTGLSRIKTTTGAENWFDPSESIKKDTDRFQELFGNEETIAVLVKAPDVFDPAVLDAIDRIGEELLENVPYADRLTSLTELEVTFGSEEGLEIINPFGDGIPEESSRIEEARRLILSRQTLKNRLVSDGCDETWIILTLHAYPKPEEREPGETEPIYVVGAAARRVLENPKWKSDAYEILPAGTPYTENEELEVMNRETSMRIIMGLAAMVVCLLVFLRSLRGLFVPLFTTIAGIGVVFGFMGWFGIVADATLMSLPIVLGMALSVGYSIHLINAIKRGLRSKGQRREAVIGAVSETGWPILFTVLTTVAGLISFLFANIGPLRWLGITCSAVVLTVYIYTFLLMPILMSFGKDVRPKGTGAEGYAPTKTDLAFGVFGKGVLALKWPILAVCVIAVAVITPGIRFTTVNMDYFEMMGLKVPYIQRLDKIVKSKLGSYLDYNVMITFPEADAAKNPETMRRFDGFVRELGALKMTKRADDTAKVSSVLDIVKEMNRALNADDPEFYAVPEDQDMLTQLLFLYEISGGTGLSQWVSEDYASLRVQVDIRGYDANSIVSDIAEIKARSAKIFPEAKVSVIGGAASYAEMNRKIVVGQLTSFAGAFAIICVMMIIAFGSVGTGLIAMIPNIAPVAVVGGLMGYLGWSLDMLTMTVMPMILGIAVDDTIHFTSQIKLEVERKGDYREAVLASFRAIGKNMFMTTCILCAAFIMYTFSPMNTLLKIGSLAAIGLSVALLADYTLTPILIYITKPFGKKEPHNKETREVA